MGRRGGSPVRPPRAGPAPRTRSTLDVLDAFPAFERFWRTARAEPVPRQVERWARDYLAEWPGLLAKLQANYAAEGVDWRAVARRHVFPRLGERLPRMRRLHRELRRTLPSAVRRTRAFLGVRFPIQFVIYVGVGVGAGWATSYEGRPACLFGLENAAEDHDAGDGWSRRVVAHEIAHLAHQHWRGARWEAGSDPWWSLYEEGFATYCERRIEPRAFGARTGERDWLPWCDAKRPWLARRFLRDAAAGRSMRPFFGSWYRVRAHAETGYYLGAEVIRAWTREAPLRAIARLPDREVRRRARATLRRFAEERPGRT